MVIKLPGARKAVGKEINDLLAPHGDEPPSMVEVSLRDSRFASVPKTRSNLVAKRKKSLIIEGPIVRPG